MHARGAAFLLCALASCAAPPRAATETPRPPLIETCGPERGDAYAAAECGAIRVFEDRRAKQGRTIDVAFARWPARSRRSTGAVFFLAGGPGAGGVGMARDMVGWASPLQATMDLVVVDQRGTWFSHALHCARDVEGRPAAGFGHIFDPDWVRQCRAFLERDADLRFYTTELAADDLDDLRAALGYERINLYGGSYGTRLAQAYMRQYPERTRAVVLDGALPFDVRVPLTYPATAQQALDRVIDDCASRPACRKSHPNLGADFARVLDRFRDGPVATSVRPPEHSPVSILMSRGDFGYAVRGILYAPYLVDNLPDWIGRAATSGDLSAFAQRYWERELDFSRTFATGLHFSVLCSEDVAFIDPSEIDAAGAGTFLGRYIIDEYRAACALWPATPVRADARRAVTTAAPTLLISGAFDPVTPPEFADRIAKALPQARHLVSPRGGHGSVYGCARSAAIYLLQSGTLTDMPDACR
jgi:pimeloyl-ACP methyl ester carboxylesterase